MTNEIAIVLPVSQNDVYSLLELLRSADPFVLGNIDVADPYDLTSYLTAKEFAATEVRALFDRNLISRIVALARGETVPESEAQAYRVACACMAFCILADILIEPAMVSFPRNFVFQG